MERQTSPAEDVAPREGEDRFPILAHRRFLLVSFFVGCSMLEYGFDKGEISAFQAMTGFLRVFGYEDPAVPSGWNIKSGPQQIISSFMLLGSFISSLLAGVFSHFLGRRHCMMVGMIILIIGITVQVVTTQLGVLYFGRLFTGLANAHLRGVAYAMAAGWVTLGGAIGAIITNATSKMMSRLSYQIPLYTLYFLPVVMLVGLFFLPESPRWLLLHGRNDQALRSLTWIRSNSCDRFEVLREFEEMRLNVERELSMDKKKAFLEQFNNRHIRRTLISVGVGLVNPALGGMFVMAFMTYFMKMVGVDDPFKWVIVGQFAGYFGQLISYPFIAMLGRRTMLLLGSCSCAISMLILAVIFQTTTVDDQSIRGKCVIFANTFYHFGFNFGVVGLVYMISGEIPAQNLRAATAGLSIGVGFIFAWLTSFTAPYFINPGEMNWGGKYGWIWLGSSVLAISFIYFLVPEVRGRSLEEIEEMFDKKVPAWKFQSYVCEGVAQANAEAMKDLDHEEAKEAHVEHVEKTSR